MHEISSATGKLLALSMLNGVGPSTLRKLAAEPHFESASITSLAERNTTLQRALEDQKAWSKALLHAEVQVEQAHRCSTVILSALDASYPALLSSVKDDPFIIFVKGQLHSEPKKSVAVIGTRQPTEHGSVIAERVTEHFVEQGWSIVSGLALGCDTIAHTTALKSGGHTIAVLAHGLHTVAPASNKALAAKIVEAGGALVSQYPFGREVLKQQFVQRDRTQAALAQGVVMIQSDLKGGSLHASRAALDYGRWLAIPYPTRKDVKNREGKVQANLLLAHGTDPEKRALLNLDEKANLDGIVVLYSKDDYLKVPSPTAVRGNDNGAIPPHQAPIF